MSAPSESRPGGWVPGIGWVALLSDLNAEDLVALTDGRIRRVVVVCSAGVVRVVKWADGEVPTEPDVLSRYDEIVMAERQRSACYCARTTKMCPDHQMFAWGVEVGLRAAGGES